MQFLENFNIKNLQVEGGVFINLQKIKFLFAKNLVVK